MLKLSNLIFIQEGLLKLPPKISQAVKKEAFGIFAAKYSILLQDKITKQENHLRSLDKKLDEWLDIKPYVLNSVVKLTDNFLKAGENSKYDKYVYEFPFEFPKMVNKEEAEKIRVKLFKFGRSEYVIRTELYDSELGEWNGYEEYSGEDNFDYALDQFDVWLANKAFPTDEINEIEYQLETKVKTLDFLNQNITQIPGMKTPEQAKTQWGANSVIELSPDMFEGWNPGGKNLDISKLLYSKYGKENSPRLFIKFEYQKTSTEKFHTPVGNEPYLGYYKSMEKWGGTDNTYLIVIVVPYVDIDSYDIEYVIESGIEQMNQTIDHEVGHLVQELIQQTVTGKAQMFAGRLPFGNPSKKISNPGRPKHELRDEEFYTRLGDTKKQIEKHLDVPIESRLRYFKNFVGYPKETNVTHYWLKTLKKESPQKYLKAVKELYKIFFPEIPQTNKLGKTI